MTSIIDSMEWDSSLPGFGIRTRLGKRGGVTKTFIFQCRIYDAEGSYQRRITIGRCDALEFKSARQIAYDLYVKTRKIKVGNSMQRRINPASLQSQRENSRERRMKEIAALKALREMGVEI